MDTLSGDRRSQRNLLSESERRQILADIAQVALSIGRDLYPDAALNDIDVGDAPVSGEAPCPRERLAFLQSAWPRVAAAVAALEAAPPVALEPGLREVSFARARRITPADLLTALRSKDFVPTPTGSSTLAARLDGRLPRRIRERVALPTFDTPANRMVKAILVVFARDLAVITDIALVSGFPRVAYEAARLRRRVRSALCRTPWRILPVLPVVPPLPPSARTHGPYRLIQEVWRRYRAGFIFDWNNPLFQLPSRDAWILYEYWCLFQVADALRGLGFRAVSSDNFAVSRSGLTFTLARGRAATLRWKNAEGQNAILTYNREFTRRSGRDGWHSRSHAMRPDITLETGGRLFVFDAKFKAYAEDAFETAPESDPVNLPLVNDLNQMHAYRDGIRDERETTRPVEGGWLLYVGRATGANHPIMGYPEVTTATPYGDGEVGALLLRPERDTHDLVGLLRFLLFSRR